MSTDVGNGGTTGCMQAAVRGNICCGDSDDDGAVVDKAAVAAVVAGCGCGCGSFAADTTSAGAVIFCFVMISLPSFFRSETS